MGATRTATDQPYRLTAEPLAGVQREIEKRHDESRDDPDHELEEHVRGDQQDEDRERALGDRG